MLKSLQEFYKPLPLVSQKEALTAQITIIKKPFVFLLMKHGLLNTIIPGKFIIDKYTNKAIPAFNLKTMLKKINNKPLVEIDKFYKELSKILGGEKSWIYNVLVSNLFKYSETNYFINIASPKE